MEKAGKENNTNESYFSQNEILNLNSLKPFEFESKTHIRVINSIPVMIRSSHWQSFCKNGVLFLLGLHIIRSSHWRCSMKKGVLKISQNSQENTCPGLRPATLLTKKIWHKCFLVNFEKCLRTPFLQNTSGRLLPFCGHWLTCSRLNGNSHRRLFFFQGILSEVKTGSLSQKLRCSSA